MATPVSRASPDRSGRGSNGASPKTASCAGMDVRAQLTVVGDGPVGAVGQAHRPTARNARRPRAARMGAGHEVGDRAARRSHRTPPLQPGTVWHTFGFPEPEIFGFLYVHPDRLASVGIFVPSWLGDPSRTAYRYLQHYIQHPALWKYLKDGTLRSWGANRSTNPAVTASLSSAAMAYARIGEGSGIDQYARRLRRGRGVDHRHATGGVRDRVAPDRPALHATKTSPPPMRSAAAKAGSSTTHAPLKMHATDFMADWFAD